MTDLKRLRELAMATAARGYCSVTSSDLLALLDALEAEQRDARRHRFIRARCTVKHDRVFLLLARATIRRRT